MTADDYARWRLEHEMLETLLARAEAAEHAILRRMRCPMDDVAIYDFLAGHTPPPWPARTAARDKQRALHAMHALIKIREVRRHTALGSENATRAAEAALFVGVLANNVLIRAAQHATTAKYARQWRNSDELQEQYGGRSPVNFIRKKTRLETRTIQRALQRISRQ
jgi:hypothetical protein